MNKQTPVPYISYLDPLSLGLKRSGTKLEAASGLYLAKGRRFPTVLH